MKKFVLSVLLFFAAITTANAQNTITMYDGTDVSGYLPVIGYYMSMPQHSQMIYPDNLLTSARGMSITQLTFYADSAYTVAFNPSFDVTLSVYANNTISGFQAPGSNGTQVYSGTIGIVNGLMTITFDNDFYYPASGGNLLVTFESEGGTGEEETYFIGVEDSTHSIVGIEDEWFGGWFDDDAWFMPKMTLTYGNPPSCVHPTQIHTTSLTTSSIQVAWSQEGGASQWQYAVAAAPVADLSAVSAVTVADSSASITGLTAGTSYYFYVRAICGAGDTSSWSVFNVQTPYCNNACQISIAMEDYYGDSWNGAHLTFTQTSHSTDVEISNNLESEMQTLSVCPNDSVFVYWTQGDYDDECSFTIYGTDGEVLYSCSECEPDDGELLVAFITDCGGAANECDAPVLNAPQTTQNSATVAWTADATTFEVALGTAGDFQDAVTVNGLSHTFTNLESGTSYTYRVRSVCGDDNYSAWTIGSFHTQEDETDCQMPMNVAVATVNENSVIVSWTENDADLWEVELTDPTATAPVIVETEDPSYTFTNLDLHNSYSVRVRSICDEDVYSDYSAPVTFGGENGIENAIGDFAVTLAPNPAMNGMTNVTLAGVNGKVAVEILDLSGRTVRAEQMECHEGCTKQVSVAGLAAGVYFVRLSGEQVNVVRKLIVK